MKNKGLKITAGILLLLVIIVLAGPKPPKPVFSKDLPVINLTSSQVAQYVAARESAVTNLKPGNASEVIYADDSTKALTEYCLLYLHGFSASPYEGYPTHVNLGKKFGMNTYIPRLAGHGLVTDDPLLNMTPDAIWNSVKEALVIAKKLGQKVILMGTSTGGSMALKLASEYPADIASLILYSPNVRIANKASFVLGLPYGLQLGRMISGGKFRIIDDPKSDPYWYNTYRVEGVVYLQQMITQTMTAKVFNKVTQPVFVGYYYKDETNQDHVVSVQAILWMFENLGTPADRKEAVAFPDAGNHAIACELYNPNWMEVFTATENFLKKTVGFVPLNSK